MFCANTLKGAFAFMKENQIEKLDKLLKMVYPQIEYDEYIPIQLINGKTARSFFFQDLEDVKSFVLTHRGKGNIYFSLASAKSVESRKRENLNKVSVIGLDFDFHGKEKISAKELTARIRSKIKLNIAAVTDTGNGYHIYIKIDRTSDLDRWNKLTRQLQAILSDEGADREAVLPTQILRLNYTFNFKDPKKLKAVNCIYITENAVSYSLDKLEKIIKNYKTYAKSKPTNTERPCISEMLRGVPKGERNTCLWLIVNHLHLTRPNDRDEALKACIEFNSKCTPPKAETIIKKEFNNIWNNYEGMSVCHFSDNEPKERILRKYCSHDCPRFTSRPTGTRKIDTVDVPRILIDKALNSGFNGVQIALLLYIYQHPDITLKELYSGISINEQTARKHLALFKKNSIVKVVNKRIVILLSSNSVYTVYEDIPMLVLNKKLTACEALVYFYLVKLNSENKQPSVMQLAEYMNADKSNISKTVDKLCEADIIRRYTFPNGAGIKYALTV